MSNAEHGNSRSSNDHLSEEYVRTDYEHVFEDMPAIVFVIEVTEDDDFVIGATNRMQRAMMPSIGASAGKRIDEVFPPDLADPIIAHYKECVQRGENIEYEEYVPSPLDRHFLTTLRPVRNKEGRIVRIIGVTRDITEKKKMEEQIRNSQEIQNLLLSKIPDIILIHVEGRITYVNESVSKITGYSPEEVIGRSIYDFMDRDEAIRIENIDTLRSRKEFVPEIYEATVIHKSGDKVSVEMRVIVIMIGGREGRLVVITDITERVISRKIEDRFRNLAEMLHETIYET
ncbi:MAG TPA: PAS domain S-box protein, partial [Spirochaetota bacterium]|nr:PAS domain S-box protein [Spirochaetota bacterium]